jgi:hypothetical protein
VRVHPASLTQDCVAAKASAPFGTMLTRKT